MKVNIERMYCGTASERTIILYRATWNKYVAFAGSEAKALLPSSFAAWRTYLVNDTQYARKTINVVLGYIRSIITYLYAQGDIDSSTYDGFRRVKYLRNNMLRGRGRTIVPTRIEPEQMRRICDVAFSISDDYAGALRRALLLVLATSGLRIGEVSRLRVDHIKEKEGNYTIDGIIVKGGKKHVAPLSLEAYEAIQDWLFQRPVNSAYVFNGFAMSDEGLLVWADKPATRSYLSDIVGASGRAAGIPNVKPHDIRKFVGTQLARKDLRLAQKVMGHASLEITLRTYVLDQVPGGITNDIMPPSTVKE